MQGEECPQRLLTGNFLLRYREKRGKEKGKRGEICKRKGRSGGDLLLLFVVVVVVFFFFFLLLSTFENDGNLFWVYQNGNFLPGKNISRREKNQEK